MKIILLVSLTAIGVASFGSLASAAGNSSQASGGPQSDEVAVIVNDSDATSRAIAAYYCERRKIPAAHICHIHTVSQEEIGRDVYQSKIEAPIGAWLTQRGLVEKILVLVTTTGVPLKISGSASPTGTASSVDSELALLYQQLEGRPRSPLEGGIRNPFFGANARFRHPQFPMYLVTRLTAYTLDDVRQMVDRSLQARNLGKVIVDGKSGTMDDGELWLRRTVNLLPKGRAVFDDTAKVLENASEVIGYAGWGSNDPNHKSRTSGLRWLPGGLATEYVSTDARTFHEPPVGWHITSWKDRAGFYADSPQSLTGDFLREGATGASGHVYEPYLAFTPHPDLLFPAYLDGWTLAESYWRSIPALSWMNVVVGDPLCRLQSN